MVRKLKFAIFVLFFLVFTAFSASASTQGVLIKKIKVVGNTVLSSKEINSVISPYEGKYLTIRQMDKIATLITNTYRKKGYILSKAYIPQQDITNHVLKIKVVQGKVGEIEISGHHPYYNSKFIKKYFEPLLKEEAFNQHDLERAVLLLNDYPKLNVKVNLKKGKTPGTTDILVVANNSMPLSLILGYDNFGSKYTSKNRYSATVNAGNLIVPGSLLSVRGILGDNYNDLHYGRVSYSIPIGVKGFRLGAYYGQGNYNVGKDLAVLDIKGKSTNYGIYASYPFIKEMARSLTGKIGFDIIHAKQTMMGQKTSEDKIRTLDLGIDYELLTAYSRNFLNFQITQGLGSIFGGMSNNDPYASRASADSTFTKFSVTAMRFQRLSDRAFLLLKLSGQYSPNNLVSYEQFYIGGADSVRGFTQAEYGGDSGYAATAELRISPLKNKKLLQWAFFIDNGFIRVNDAVPGQHSERTLTGIGTGVRLSLPYDFNVRADVGVPVHPSTNADGHGVSFYLQATKTFK